MIVQSKAALHKKQQQTKNQRTKKTQTKPTTIDKERAAVYRKMIVTDLTHFLLVDKTTDDVRMMNHHKWTCLDKTADDVILMNHRKWTCLDKTTDGVVLMNHRKWTCLRFTCNNCYKVWMNVMMNTKVMLVNTLTSSCFAHAVMNVVVKAPLITFVCMAVCLSVCCSI